MSAYLPDERGRDVEYHPTLGCIESNHGVVLDYLQSLPESMEYEVSGIGIASTGPKGTCVKLLASFDF